MLSVGAVQFRKDFPGPVDEVAAKFGCQGETITRWRTARRLPGAEQRVRIHKAGGPDPEDWNTPYKGKADGEDFKSTPGEATPEQALSAADVLYQSVVNIQRQIDSGNYAPEENLKKASEAARILVALGKITGATLSSERQILNSPPWKALVARLTDALADHPAALDAVIASFDPTS